jgi:hypothetical protein
MIKKILAVFLFMLPFVSKGQQSPSIIAFTKFVSKNYRLPDGLKANCEWMYAIVKVKTDSNNKILKYELVNKQHNSLKGTFDFIIGYKFPKKEKINGHPIVFYMGIDNLEGCTEKPGDKVFYAPNNAAYEIWSNMTQLMIRIPFFCQTY